MLEPRGDGTQVLVGLHLDKRAKGSAGPCFELDFVLVAYQVHLVPE